jgi:hypothetical protein
MGNGYGEMTTMIRRLDLKTLNVIWRWQHKWHNRRKGMV